ncbi:hypothetical protein L6452_28698 [Arctium lappa]|uniref:Uncharacterized protein n=1 Tax=Arctium lappa TaxID=4217 RepID=A0ACB8ZY96_ARCLA|nr:hypothetical protein L6452_28698 [Arctium lappa]
MADQTNNSLSDSKLDATKSTNKRKNTPPIDIAAISKNPQLDHHQTDYPPPHKCPHEDKQPAKEEDEDMKDTATSNPKKIEKEKEEKKEDEGVTELPDIDVLEAIIRFHSRNGVYPFENSSAMRDFLSPLIRLGFGKPKELVAKIEQVKNKFKKEDHGGGENVIVEAGKEKEFELWMKINWGKKASGDDGNEGGCS